MHRLKNFSWEDARIFLSVAEHKSFSAAAKILNIGQPTISRRIKSLEARLELQLFNRGKFGAEPSNEALSLIPAARQMEKWATEFNRLANQNNVSISGLVTIAAPPGIAVEELAPFAALLKQREPSIDLEILSAVDYVDLSRGIADLAIRAQAPLEPELVSLYSIKVQPIAVASKDYLMQLTKPCSIENIDWISWGGRYKNLEPRPTLEKLVEGFKPRFSSDDYLVIKSAVEAGMGAAILNKPVLSNNSQLLELDLGIDLPDSEFHLVCNRSMRHLPRVQTVADLLIDTISDTRASD